MQPISSDIYAYYSQVIGNASAQNTVVDAANTAINTTKGAEQQFEWLSHADPIAALCFAVALICGIVVIASFFSDRLKSKANWLGTMGGRLGLSLLGDFFLLLPIAIHMPTSSGALLWPTLGESIPAALYMMFNTLGFGANLVGWTPVIHTIVGTGVLATVYYWALLFYIILLPLMLTLTAASVVLNGFSGVALTVSAFKKAIHKRSIYVFYSFDENSATLANDILDKAYKAEKPTRRHPLLIFCKTNPNPQSNDAAKWQQVKENAYGNAQIVATPLALQSIPAHLPAFVQSRCEVAYLILSQDDKANVASATELTNALTNKLLHCEVAALKYNISAVDAHNEFHAKTILRARNIRIWCQHANPTSDSFFDTLGSGSISPTLIQRLQKKSNASVKTIGEELAPVFSRLRNLLDVNLIATQRECIWDAFTTIPLTSVLDACDISQAMVKFQKLYVLVFGVGAHGTEAVRAAFWFGRLPGVQLRIIGIDICASARAEFLSASWNAMMEETVQDGVPSVRLSLLESLTNEQDSQDQKNASVSPTIAFLETHARSPLVDALLEGEQVTGFSAGHKIQDTPLQIEQDARIYAMVTLGDDSTSLACALHVRRMLDERTFEQRLDPGVPPAQNFQVSVHLRDKSVFEGLRQSTQEGAETSIEAFGWPQSLYSYNKIIASKWDRAALNMQALLVHYRQSDALAPVSRARAMEKLNALHINRLSTLAAMRFTPYRLWCVGIGIADTVPTEEIAQQWAQKLGIEHFAIRIAEDDTLATSLFAPHTYATRALDHASQVKRQKELDAHDAGIAKAYRILCIAGELEHARWCAFMRAQGWALLEGSFSDVERLNEYLGIAIPHTGAYPHKSVKLRRHYYLVEAIEQYRKHGAECIDDPEATDRMIAALCVRSLRSQDFEDEASSR